MASVNDVLSLPIVLSQVSEDIMCLIQKNLKIKFEHLKAFI